MLKTIWSRYFLKEIFHVFFLFLFCFYGLYVIIDYTSHSTSFHQHQNRFDWYQFLVYYGTEFVRRSDVLVPFGLMVATVRTLTKLNQHNELTALRAAGIPLATLMRPFIHVGLLFTTLLYVNEQWVLPYSMNLMRQIDETKSSYKRKQHNQLSAQHLVLEDESTLIFQSYDSTHGLFFDSYWVRSPDEFYRILYLDPHADIPTGEYVDTIKRQENGLLSLTSTAVKQSFPQMIFNKKTLTETITPIDDLSLTKLWEKRPTEGIINSDKEAHAVTALYRKLTLPWLCLFAVLAPMPLCVRFNRQIPIFFLYAINIFGLVAVYLILDAAQVLGKRQFTDPFIVTWLPFLFFFSLFGYRFYRMQNTL